jgi:hypothetical protein
LSFYGFKRGFLSIRRTAGLTTFIGSFNDVAAAKEAALAEISPGADMLSQCRQIRECNRASPAVMTQV